MERKSASQLPLVVIVGPTASGKTSLAIDLAQKYNGEIVCADSRTIYKYMDIGTAKPSSEEQATVPHWGLNLVEPGERFTAADFKAYALEKIQEIRDRGHIPFLVGGTGLYIDAMIFDYQFGGEYSPQQRQHLETMTLSALHDYCYNNNITLPENYRNKRYVIRAIEQRGIGAKRRASPIDNTIIVGIATEKEDLRRRIAARTEQLFADGVVEEATLLGKKYGWASEAMTGNIYPIIHRYLLGEITLNESKDLFTTVDIRLAKRQITWLKRNPFIKWGSLKELKKYVATLLAS